MSATTKLSDNENFTLSRYGKRIIDDAQRVKPGSTEKTGRGNTIPYDWIEPFFRQIGVDATVRNKGHHRNPKTVVTAVCGGRFTVFAVVGGDSVVPTAKMRKSLQELGLL